MAQAPVLPVGFELPLEPRLPRIGSIDQVALEERAATLAKRSIKREAKLFALELAVRMTDLTTLEGADTPGKVAALASKAIRPDPADPSVPSVAAICIYPNLVPTAVERVRGSSVKVASVATAFPSGQSPLETKLDEVRWVVEHGADEVDMDVNALDVSGADGEVAELERLAAENVKRVVRGAADDQSPWEISRFLELKTVWHPIGV